MLRRPPTAITLTAEDIAIYEDTRAKEALQRELALQQQAQAQTQAQHVTPNRNQNTRDPQAGDRMRAPQVKTREERLGLGLGMGGGPSRG